MRQRVARVERRRAAFESFERTSNDLPKRRKTSIDRDERGVARHRDRTPDEAQRAERVADGDERRVVRQDDAERTRAGRVLRVENNVYATRVGLDALESTERRVERGRQPRRFPPRPRRLGGAFTARADRERLEPGVAFDEDGARAAHVLEPVEGPEVGVGGDPHRAADGPERSERGPRLGPSEREEVRVVRHEDVAADLEQRRERGEVHERGAVQDDGAADASERREGVVERPLEVVVADEDVPVHATQGPARGAGRGERAEDARGDEEGAGDGRARRRARVDARVEGARARVGRGRTRGGRVRRARGATERERRDEEREDATEEGGRGRHAAGRAEEARRAPPRTAKWSKVKRRGFRKPLDACGWKQDIITRVCVVVVVTRARRGEDLSLTTAFSAPLARHNGGALARPTSARRERWRSVREACNWNPSRPSSCRRVRAASNPRAIVVSDLFETTERRSRSTDDRIRARARAPLPPPLSLPAPRAGV